MTATTRHASPATRERRLFPGLRWGAALVGGAVVFMLLSGLVLARFTGARGQAA